MAESTEAALVRLQAGPLPDAVLSDLMSGPTSEMLDEEGAEWPWPFLQKPFGKNVLRQWLAERFAVGDSFPEGVSAGRSIISLVSSGARDRATLEIRGSPARRLMRIRCL